MCSLYQKSDGQQEGSVLVTPLGYKLVTPLGYILVTPTGYILVTPLRYILVTPLRYLPVTPLGYIVVTPLGYILVTPLRYILVTPTGIETHWYDILLWSNHQPICGQCHNFFDSVTYNHIWTDLVQLGKITPGVGGGGHDRPLVAVVWERCELPLDPRLIRINFLLKNTHLHSLFINQEIICFIGEQCLIWFDQRFARLYNYLCWFINIVNGSGERNDETHHSTNCIFFEVP